MKRFWWIFTLIIVCAILSKQIDESLAKLIADSKKRAVMHCVTGIISLSIIGVLIYMATATFAGRWSVILAIAPVSIFIFAIVLGALAGRSRNKKQNTEQ